MKPNYVPPKLFAESFTCPHCNTLSQFKFSSLYENRGYNQLYAGRCLNCGKNVLWIDDKYVYPDIVAEQPNTDMPESVKQLYNEAGLIYNKSPRAACALLRLAIDRLCNELGEKDRDINKNIGALVKKGLPQTIQKALDVVRVVGNKAVHPGEISFDVDDKETALKLMKLLNIITERMISEPNEIDSMFGSLPESAKASIQKRDS